MKEQLQAEGWLGNAHDASPLVPATLTIAGPQPRAGRPVAYLLSVAVGGAEVHVLVPKVKPAPRILRKLESFFRRQGRIEPEMNVAEEIRAMEVLAGTLERLDPPTRRRAVRWLVDKYLTSEAEPRAFGTAGPMGPATRGRVLPLDPPEPVPPSEATRIARDHVLGAGSAGEERA